MSHSDARLKNKREMECSKSISFSFLMLMLSSVALADDDCLQVAQSSAKLYIDEQLSLRGWSASTGKLAQSVRDAFLFNVEQTIALDRLGTFVKTGDIEGSWLRDSTYQLSVYSALLSSGETSVQRCWRSIFDGLVTRLSYFVAHNVYANSFRKQATWRVGDVSRQKGQEGIVHTYNFELDSLAAFAIFVGRYAHMNPASPALASDVLAVAVEKMLYTMRTEQNHALSDQYYYDELASDGKGAPTAPTGMVWSAFRPSDDACRYNYLVPANMMSVVALRHVESLLLNHMGARDDDGDIRLRLARQLRSDIELGIFAHGTMLVDGERVFAYEVDGLGNALFMDDANWPSLLSAPLFGFIDAASNRSAAASLYAATRRHVLNGASNPYYFDGEAARGVGSPHTPYDYVWPLGVIAQAATAPKHSAQRQSAVDVLLNMTTANSDGLYLQHESVEVNEPRQWTRAYFGWANALYSWFMLSQQ
jgi:uncharacterized protein